jgi:protein SCO1/2
MIPMSQSRFSLRVAKGRKPKGRTALGSLTVAAVLAFVPTHAPSARAQGMPPSDVGIDEKLGMEVALDAVLKDEEGGDVTLRQLIDKPTILVLNYFRCGGICPLLLSGVVNVCNQVKLEPDEDYQVIAVSFDPTDTPEMARDKRINYLKLMTRPFPPRAFRFLTGDAKNTKAVADSVGFNFRPAGEMFVHPGAIIMLTPKGTVSRYMYGTSFLPADVEMAIQEAALGEVRPTISQVLAFCSPEERGAKDPRPHPALGGNQKRGSQHDFFISR